MTVHVVIPHLFAQSLFFSSRSRLISSTAPSVAIPQAEEEQLVVVIPHRSVLLLQLHQLQLHQLLPQLQLLLPLLHQLLHQLEIQILSVRKSLWSTQEVMTQTTLTTSSLVVLSTMRTLNAVRKKKPQINVSELPKFVRRSA
jgi:hypothetical protein